MYSSNLAKGFIVFGQSMLLGHETLVQERKIFPWTFPSSCPTKGWVVVYWLLTSNNRYIVRQWRHIGPISFILASHILKFSDMSYYSKYYYITSNQLMKRWNLAEHHKQLPLLSRFSWPCCHDYDVWDLCRGVSLELSKQWPGLGWIFSSRSIL